MGDAVKLLAGFIVFATIGLLAIYHFAGVKDVDPQQQYNDARAAIVPGMTWKQIVSEYKPPKFYRLLEKKVVTRGGVGGQPYEMIEPTAKNGYVEQHIANRLEQKRMPHGFQFEYKFANNLGLVVKFDSDGVATEIEELKTVYSIIN